MRSRFHWQRPSSTDSTVVDRQDQTVWLSSNLTNKALTRLIHMNLSSVHGFHAVAELDLVPKLNSFAPWVCWQRLRQCRDLCQMADRKLTFRPIWRDPAAAELRRIWRTARHCLSHDKVFRALEQIEMAELILEHAYRAAAATERNRLVVDLYREHVVEVANARRQFGSAVAVMETRGRRRDEG